MPRSRHQKIACRCATLISAIAFGVGAAAAEQDIVTQRQQLMNESERHGAILVQIVARRRPFDAAAIDAAFAQWAETARKLPDLFPENAKGGLSSRAAAKIWLYKNDFAAKTAALAQAVRENRDKAKSSLKALGAAVAGVGRACDNCHKEYRLSKR